MAMAAMSPGLILRIGLTGVFLVACSGMFLSVFGGVLEHFRLSRFDPRAFRRGPVVFRALVDLNELSDRIVMPPLGEIVTMRSVRLRMASPEHGNFVARQVRVGSPAAPRRSPILLKGVVRLQGRTLEARGRLSPWAAVFFGCHVVAGLAFAMIGAALAAPMFLAAGIVMCGAAALMAGISLRNARQDASDAVAEVASILAGRSDAARAYPDSN